MVDHDVVWLNISVHDSHTVAIVQGLWTHRKDMVKILVHGVWVLNMKRAVLSSVKQRFDPLLSMLYSTEPA